MKRRNKAILGAAAVVALLAGQAAADTWTWTGADGDGLWQTATNWSGFVVPSTNDVAVMNNGDTITYANWTNANLFAFRVQNGTMNIDSGYIEATANTRWWDCWVGADNNVTGTVNQTGGEAVLGFVEIGRNQLSHGVYNLSGGELNITYNSRYAGYHFFIGTPDSRNGGGNGLFEISNDAVFSTSQGVMIGASTTIGTVDYATNGTFSIVGSDCSIDVGSWPSNSTGGAWYQCAGNTLKVGIDDGGVAPVNIHGGDATFEFYAEIEPHILSGVDTNGLQETWTVMVATNGTIEATGLILAPGVDASLWNFGVTNGNELWVSYGKGGWGGLTVPASPNLKHAWPIDPTSVRVEWDAAGGADSYVVKRSETSGGPYTMIASNVTDVVYTNTGVTTEATYYYVASAVNPFGESDDSSEQGVFVVPFTIITYGEPYNEFYTVYRAFDKDKGTHYDGETDEAWIGVDYGAGNEQRIYSFDYVPRNWGSHVTYATNARVQGANSADWTDAVDLTTVTLPLQGNPNWNTFEITDTTEFRYVRLFTAPNLRSKSFAEVKFMTADDYATNNVPKYWLEDENLVVGGDYDAAALSNTDGDAHEAWKEFIAGTDPNDINSVLQITSFADTTNGPVVAWQSVQGKVYSVLTTPDLTGGFGVLESGITGLVSETSYTGTVSGADTEFFRISVE